LKAYELFHHLRFLENEDGWHRNYMMLLRYLKTFFNIHFHELDFTVVLPGQFIGYEAGWIAGSTPFSSKTDKYRGFTFQYFFFEILVVNLFYVFHPILPLIRTIWPVFLHRLLTQFLFLIILTAGTVTLKV